MGRDNEDELHILCVFYLLEENAPDLRKQNVISYNATNTMVRNRKACRTAAIPVSFVLQEGKT